MTSLGKLVNLIREGGSLALRDRRSTVALAITVMLIVTVVLSTTGRAAATEHSVVSSIESLGARTVILTDAERKAGINPLSVDRIRSVDGVEWAFGIGPALRGTVADTRPGVSVRTFTGDQSVPLTISHGRWPTAPGEAIAGRRAVADLGLGDVAGPVSVGYGVVGVVGEMSGDGLLDFMNDTVVYIPDPDSAVDVVQIYLAVADPAHAQAVGDEALALLVQEGNGPVSVEVSSSVIALGEVISGQLGASSRVIMLIVLAVGLLLTTSVTVALCASQRRNFGRMRALGASRSELVVVVLTSVGVTSVVASALGVAVGLATVWVLADGVMPPASFTAGVATLACLTALVGGAFPAVAAARRDPVSILRVP